MDIKAVFGKKPRYFSVEDVNLLKDKDCILIAKELLNGKGSAKMSTECACGKISNRFVRDLLSGKIKSCYMCSMKKLAIDRTYINPNDLGLYSVWQGMRNRCRNSKGQDWRLYGGRGICVCTEWDRSFTVFLEWSIDNGYERGKKLQIDRIDVNCNYEPSNCRWVTNKINSNNRRNNRRIEYMGINKTISEWIDFLGVSSHSFKFQFYKSKKPFSDVVEKFNKQHLFS